MQLSEIDRKEFPSKSHHPFGLQSREESERLYEHTPLHVPMYLLTSVRGTHMSPAAALIVKCDYH